MWENREQGIFFWWDRGKLHSVHNVYDNVSDVVFQKFYMISKLAFHCGFTLFVQDDLEISMY